MKRYQNKDFAHGIMFHHFTNENHPRGQGAINADETAAMIEFLDPSRILGAEEWMERTAKGTLRDHHLCITFDDSLLCQYDVAWPVLKHYGITGFFFVYSSVFENILEKLEIYRYFRTVAFKDVDSFYDAFFKEMDIAYPGMREKGLKSFDSDVFLKDYPFFTLSDKVFRYLRDNVLVTAQYNAIMDGMIERAHFNVNEIAKNLWMTEQQLVDLHKHKNVIGLHSYSHPLTLGRLTEEQQRSEYADNNRHLSGLVGQIKTMSHPCNSYNTTTLSILKDMNVDIGFCADMAEVPNRSAFEIPREDHANILRMMRA